MNKLENLCLSMCTKQVVKQFDAELGSKVRSISSLLLIRLFMEHPEKCRMNISEMLYLYATSEEG